MTGSDALLREDAGYLADAAVHMADHMASLNLYCEDADNVRHFAAKVRAALDATKPEPLPPSRPNPSKDEEMPAKRKRIDREEGA